MKTVERIAKWLMGELRFEWDMHPDVRREQQQSIVDALYLARRLKNREGDALLGRIIRRLKKQESTLRGWRIDLADGKADSVSEVRDELVIHRAAITGARPPFRRTIGGRK